MNIYQATINRRSIRRYKDIPIPYDVLESLVNAARLAPTGKNRQLCEHIVIDDELLLPKIFDNINLGGESAQERMPRAYIITLINSRLEKELADISQEKETGGHIISTLCGAGMAVENNTGCPGTGDRCLRDNGFQSEGNQADTEHTG